MPVASDLRYNWVRLRLARIDPDELAELLVGRLADVRPQDGRRRVSRSGLATGNRRRVPAESGEARADLGPCARCVS